MRVFRGLVCALGIPLLAGCELAAPGPDGNGAGPSAPVTRSAKSDSLARYFGQVQADLLARGLLRTDGGGPDTPFTPDMLARNFEQIVFYDEYVRGGGLRRSGGQAGKLRRWAGPVRVNLEFGASVPDARRAADRATVSGYVARLARVTGHPISETGRRPNFHVLVMGEDDKATTQARVAQIVPGASAATTSLFTNLPRSIHCLVVAFSAADNDNNYSTAIALVRAEHPDLMRKSCFHEEIAQGLGLANDSPAARPSIFNDDDEFALLTTHDEKLLAMLYDKRLASGMSADQARPVIRILAREQTGRNF